MAWKLVEDAESLAQDGGVLGVSIEGVDVAVYRLGDEYFATGNICTHQFALLSEGFVEGGCVECPLHQGLFDIRTGKALGAPVTKDIATYAVKIEDGQVYVDVQQPGTASDEAARDESIIASDTPREADERRFVIVGGGQAAACASREMRAAGFTGQIVIVTEEQALPYERPPLSKEILLGRSGGHEATMLDQHGAAELNVDFRCGVRAEHIDTEAHRLTLSDGESLTYDKLLIATGARPRPLPIPGIDLPWVHELRTLEDAITLKRALKRSGHVAIIGGGFIGLEVASAARQMGCEVTLLEAGDRLCGRALHPMAALRLHRVAEAQGVKILTGARLTSLTAEGHQAALHLEDAPPVIVDTVVVGVGVIPNDELAVDAGIEVDNGIVVDRFGRTSANDVFAAGDVAMWPGSEDRRIRLESWHNAQEQAVSSARNMAGIESPYDATPWFWTDQFGLNVQLLGLPLPNHEVIVRKASDTAGEVLYIHDGKKLSGVVAFDNPKAIREAKPWLASGISVEKVTKIVNSLSREVPVSSTKRIPSMPVKRNGNMTDLSQYYLWPEEGLTRVPDWVYTDPYIYQLEVEKIFHGPTWNYVGLEAEIPNAGDFIRSNVGPTPVVVSRDEEGGINVFLNRCSHRAVEFCRELRGNNAEFVCPYHQWSYDLKGNLSGIPFRRGTGGKGGLPKDFKNCDHGPKKLAATTRNGVIFASFHHDMEPLEDYLGPTILKEFDATFDGRKLKVLGYYRNSLPGNWKLYHENLKDPYHATLLHTFLVSFGLLVAGNESKMICDDSGRHGVMASAKSESGKVADEDRKEMRAFRADFRLKQPSMLDYVQEFESQWSVTMQTIWPNLIVQREMNTLGVRQIVPAGTNEFVMNWTMFCFEGDDEELIRHRMRQGNLMGPAGFLGLEDNEAMKFVQDGMKRSIEGSHMVAMDPDTGAGSSDTLISESAIRAMYKHWRAAIGIG